MRQRQRHVPVTMGSPRFRTMEATGCTVIEAWFPPNAELAPHTHDHPIFGVMLHGRLPVGHRASNARLSPGVGLGRAVRRASRESHRARGCARPRDTAEPVVISRIHGISRVSPASAACRDCDRCVAHRIGDRRWRRPRRAHRGRTRANNARHRFAPGASDNVTTRPCRRGSCSRTSWCMRGSASGSACPRSLVRWGSARRTSPASSAHTSVRRSASTFVGFASIGWRNN